MRPGVLIIRNSAKINVVLPLPDSPTRPKRSPLYRVRSTLLTARAMPRRVSKWTSKPRMSSSTSLSAPAHTALRCLGLASSSKPAAVINKPTKITPIKKIGIAHHHHIPRMSALNVMAQ